MSDDAMDLNDEGVQAAELGYFAGMAQELGHALDVTDVDWAAFRIGLRAAIAAYLRAVPESDEQRDKADQWDAAQPMIAAMTDVVVVARKMHTDSRVRLLNAYDWMELTNALNAVTRLSPDEAAGGE